MLAYLLLISFFRAKHASHSTNLCGSRTPCTKIEQIVVGLNFCTYLQAYNVSDSGEYMWEYGSSNNQATFQVDMARHADVSTVCGGYDCRGASQIQVAPLPLVHACTQPIAIDTSSLTAPAGIRQWRH